MSTPATDTRSGARVRFSLTPRVLALFAVLFLTLTDGFYNSLNVEYGGKHPTFLFLPEDLHADLVKTTLSFPPYPPIDDSGWNPLYQKFHQHNRYGGLAEAREGKFSDLHVPPFAILLFLILKRVIIAVGPSALVAGYYLVALSAAAFLALKWGGTFLEALFIYVVLVFSYPFLMILSRGSFGALFTSLPLIGLIYEVLVGKRLVLAALYLALALNFRPNAAFFFPIFLVFGLRGFLRATAIAAVLASTIGLASYIVAEHFYPGYDYTIFQKALRAYSENALLLREGPMNSLFGLLLPIVDLFHLSTAAAGWLASICTGSGAVLVLLLAWFYWRGQIDPFDYAFGLSALYILATPIFAPYHLFFLFVFLALWGHAQLPTRFHGARLTLLIVTVLVLAPKDYVTFKSISPEGVLNALSLLVALALIVWNRHIADAPVEAGNYGKRGLPDMDSNHE